MTIEEKFSTQKRFRCLGRTTLESWTKVVNFESAQKLGKSLCELGKFKQCGKIDERRAAWF